MIRSLHWIYPYHVGYWLLWHSPKSAIMNHPGKEQSEEEDKGTRAPTTLPE